MAFFGGGGGGAQGQVRYALILDDQATAKLNTFNNSMKQSVQPVQAVNREMGALSNNFKGVQGGLTSSNTLFGQTATQSKSLGTSIADTTKKYAGFATGLSVTTSSVLNLAAGFRDYGDAQIAVDRAQRKLSLATEAQTKANDKLDKLVKSGITSGKEYAQAQLDVQQANQQVAIATQIVGERQEDLFDAQSQFVASLAPAVLGIVGTMGSAFKDLGLNMGTLTKTFGSVKSVIPDLISKFAGIGTAAANSGAPIGGLGTKISTISKVGGSLKGALVNLATSLFGIGTAGTAAGVGTTAAAGGIQAVDKSSKLASISVKGLAGALGLIAIPLAGLLAFQAAQEVNQKAMERTGVESKNLIQRMQEHDTQFGRSAVELNDYEKEVEDFRKTWFGSLIAPIGDAIMQIPGLKKTIGDMRSEVEASTITVANFGGSWTDFIAYLRKSNQPLDNAIKGMKEAGFTADEMNKIIQGVDKSLQNNTYTYQKAAPAIQTVEQRIIAETAARKASKNPIDVMIRQKMDEQIAVQENLIRLQEYAKMHNITIPAAAKNDAAAIEKLILTWAGFDTGVAKTNTVMSEQEKQLLANKGIWMQLPPSMVGATGAMAKAGDAAFFTGDKMAGLTGSMKELAEQKAAEALEKEAMAANKLNAEMAPLQAQTEARTEEMRKLSDELKYFGDTTGASIQQLRGMKVEMDAVNKITEEQKYGFFEDEAALLELANTNDAYSQDLEKLARNYEDNVSEMKLMIAETIDYASALTDTTEQQELQLDAFLEGTIQAKQFFTGLVKGTQQEYVFNASVAEGAYELNLQSEMMSFSTGKMQDLIKSVYSSEKAYLKWNIAVAQNTDFLEDNILKQAIHEEGTLKGIQTANDWTVTMMEQTKATQAEHDQLVRLAERMTKLNNLSNLSSEELRTLMSDFDKTGNAANAFAGIMTDRLTPSFERLSSIIQSKDMKELRKNLKDLELPKGFNKDLDDAFKPLQGAAESARKAGNAMDILVTAGENMSKKDLAKNLKAFRKELENMKDIKGTSAPVDEILDSLKTMSPQELDQHTGSFQFLRDTINKYGSLPTDKAQEFLDMYNSEVPKAGNASTTAAPKIDTLSAALKKFGIAFTSIPTEDRWSNVTRAADLLEAKTGFKSRYASSNLGKDDTKKTDDTKVTKMDVDNTAAIKKVDAVTKRILAISNIVPKIDIINTTAVKKVDAVTKRILAISDLTPKPQLDNTAMIKKVDQVTKRILSLEKLEPKPQLDNTAMIKKVDAVAKRIMGLPDGEVTVKVKYDTSAKPAGIKSAQHGMHEMLREDTVILAHANERVDIGPLEKSRTPGGMNVGPTLIEVNNIIMNERITRKFKAEQGKNRFTMGA